MVVLPFRRHGQRRVAQIQAVLQQRLDRWRAQWAAEPGNCDVQTTAGTMPAVQGQWWHCAGADGYAHVAHNGLEQLGAGLAAVPGGQSSAIAAGIGRRAFVDLLQELVSSSDTPGMGPPPSALQCDPRHGALCFSVSLPGAQARLYLSLTACDALVPTQVAVNEPALASRRSALLACSASLYATLELGSADLGVASSLRPGETIRTTRISDAVVKVHAADGSTVFTASLHSSEGRKALRCLSVQTHPGMK